MPKFNKTAGIASLSVQRVKQTPRTKTFKKQKPNVLELNKITKERLHQALVDKQINETSYKIAVYLLDNPTATYRTASDYFNYLDAGCYVSSTIH